MRNIFTVETLKLFASCITRFSHALQHSSQASQHSSRVWNFTLRAMCSLMRDVLRLVSDEAAKILPLLMAVSSTKSSCTRSCANGLCCKIIYLSNLCDYMVFNI